MNDINTRHAIVVQRRCTVTVQTRQPNSSTGSSAARARATTSGKDMANRCLLLLLATSAAAVDQQPPCPAKPCPAHPGRTFCPSVSTPGQCDKPSHPPCPPCKAPPPPPTGACTTEFDCSLGGECKNGTCVCDPTWKPPNCVELNLLPVNKSSQGYLRGQPGSNQSTASWGGQAVFDGGLWHLIYADFDKNCGLGCWGTNSQIARAVSTSPTGPFRKVQVVAPPFHHNPTINRRPGGGYVIVSIGNGTGSVLPATTGQQQQNRSGDSVRSQAGDPYEAGIITMLYADKIEGPWKRRPGVILQPVSTHAFEQRNEQIQSILRRDLSPHPCFSLVF